MKKLILLCFLGGVCLFGSNVIGQSRVAASPEVPDFPHYSTASLRSGETRSEIISGGFSLVDDSISLGQGSLGSLAGGDALIYGELINPDSLGPLQVEFRPYYMNGKSSFLVEVEEPELKRGETFDGIMNPVVRKFSSILEMGDRPGYFSVLLEGRALVDDFLIMPGDRIKLSFDLRTMDLLFGGEDAAFYEAQYAVLRERKRLAFDAPRQLIAKPDSRLLNRPGNKEKLERFSHEFGSHLLVLEPGKESLDHLLQGLSEDNEEVIGLLAVLNVYQDKLDELEYGLLEAQVRSAVPYSVYSTFRKFHYPEFGRRFSKEEQEAYKKMILDSFDRFDDHFAEEVRLVSKEYLNYALEKSILTALFEGSSLSEVVDSQYGGEMAERLKTSYLSQYLSQLPNQAYMLEKYLDAVQSYPYRDRIEGLKRSHVPGGLIEPVVLVDLGGNQLTEEELKGEATLLYFYFSSCSHSASYFENYLFPLYQEVKDHGVRLIAVSVDEDPVFWKSRIEKYSDASLLNVNLRGESKKKWKEVYEIHGYPKIMFLDRDAHILSFDIRTLGEDQESLITEFKTLYQSVLD